MSGSLPFCEGSALVIAQYCFFVPVAISANIIRSMVVKAQLGWQGWLLVICYIACY